jgi:hypothetical protein
VLAVRGSPADAEIAWNSPAQSRDFLGGAIWVHTKTSEKGCGGCWAECVGVGHIDRTVGIEVEENWIGHLGKTFLVLEFCLPLGGFFFSEFGGVKREKAKIL